MLRALLSTLLIGLAGITSAQEPPASPSVQVATGELIDGAMHTIVIRTAQSNELTVGKGDDTLTFLPNGLLEGMHLIVLYRTESQEESCPRAIIIQEVTARPSTSAAPRD